MTTKSDSSHLAQLLFSQKDELGERGRFGLVFRGKLDGKLDVAIKRVERKKTKFANSQFYYNANGHPNIINFFCLVASGPYMYKIVFTYVHGFSFLLNLFLLIF